MTVFFDLETDEFIDKVTKVWCVGLKIDDGEPYVETNMDRAISVLKSADRLIGHNIIKFDLPVIRKLFSIDLYSVAEVVDTLILSKLAFPNLVLIDSSLKQLPQKLKGSHSLKAWGIRLGNYKGEHDDWSQLSDEMIEYCKQDINVTVTLYHKLLTKGVTDKAIALENKFAYIMQQQEQHGWLFDCDRASQLHVELVREKQQLEKQLSETFRPLKIWTPVKKAVQFKKDGSETEAYKKQLARGCRTNSKGEWGFYDTLVFNPASRHHIVRWLTHLYKWKPTRFTEKNTPIVDESVLSELEYPEAKLLVHYFEVNKLLGQLAEGDNAWLKLVAEDSRIHGTIDTLGAVTRRCTHRNPNMAQVPSSRAYKGTECRALFTVPKGKKLVGCDADALELRTLSHYMAKYDGGEYGKAVDSGDKALGTDIHTLNQKAAGLPTRDDAKTFIYAFLYGAGSEKIGSIVGGGANEGSKLKKTFLKKLPALKALSDGVQSAVEAHGFLRALDGNKYFIRSSHSALNTLLQGAGALVMKYFACKLYDLLVAHGFWGTKAMFVGNIHDEIQIEVDEDIAEQVASLCSEAFTLITEELSFRVPLKGSARIGNNWAETH